MRRPLVAGNWKMHGSKASVDELSLAIREGAQALSGVDIAVFPPYLFLPQVAALLAGSSVAWGAQNVAHQPEGAYTGEISPIMLQEFGCRYVMIGHSERRHIFGETDSLIARKFALAVEAGLWPIVCVGETLADREADHTEQVIEAQLNAILTLDQSAKLLQNAVIAYEPVWAIGTGKTAIPEEAQAVHAFIRTKVARLDIELADKMRILYGGSVKVNNAKELFAQADIDGGLIGGASLEAEQFLGICQCSKSS